MTASTFLMTATLVGRVIEPNSPYIYQYVTDDGFEIQKGLDRAQLAKVFTNCLAQKMVR